VKIGLAESADNFVDGISTHLPTHLGSHPNYDDVIEAIDDILNANNILPSQVNSLSNSQINDMIDDIEDKVLDILENWQPSKLN